jgi:hypothetical protein
MNAPISLYSGQDNELNVYQIASLIVDYTDPRFNSLNGLAGSINSGVTYEVHGEWIYVDSSSVGAPLCTLYNDSEDSRTFALQPGRSIRTPFDRLRVFSTLGQNSNLSDPSTILNPTSKIFYGMGECPFTDGVAHQSTVPIAYTGNNAFGFGSSPVTQTPAAFTSRDILVPSSAWISACLQFSQVTGAAETSFLLSAIGVNFVDGTSLQILPDFVQTFNVSPAAVGVGRNRDRYFGFRLPKSSKSITILAANVGNAATNNILMGSSSVFIG